MKKKSARFQPLSDVTNLRFQPYIRTRDFWYRRTRPLFFSCMYCQALPVWFSVNFYCQALLHWFSAKFANNFL